MTHLDAFGMEFANELQVLIRQTLGTGRSVRCVRHRGRTTVRPGSTQPVAVSLTYRGKLAARLKFNYEIELDSSGKYPAVTKSEIHLLSASTNRPVLRYEYLRRPNRVPAAHWHVHGENTEFGRIMGGIAPVNISLDDLHLPVGGSRFRPSLEDFIEFLILDLKFDHTRDWRSAIRRGRENWRKTQVAVAVRDSPRQAVQALRELGYAVEPLPHALRDDNLRRLREL